MDDSAPARHRDALQKRIAQFELQQLADNALLERTVFVVDESADSRLLEKSVGSRVDLLRVESRSGRQIGSILRALRACETPKLRSYGDSAS